MALRWIDSTTASAAFQAQIWAGWGSHCLRQYFRSAPKARKALITTPSEASR
jgi:hypothetical protein